MSRFSRWLMGPQPVQIHRPWQEMFRDVMDALPRDGIFIDLGANVGNVTAEALSYGHHVYAFEPDPSALDVLKGRFGSNPRVTIIPKAVGARARVATFYQSPDGNTEYSSLNAHEAHVGGVSFAVEVIDLPAFMASLDAPIAAIKMDIEGAEVECLDAILDSRLHRNVGMFLVETHGHFSRTLRKEIRQIKKRISREKIRNIDLEWI